MNTYEYKSYDYIENKIRLVEEKRLFLNFLFLNCNCIFPVMVCAVFMNMLMNIFVNIHEYGW